MLQNKEATDLLIDCGVRYKVFLFSNRTITFEQKNITLKSRTLHKYLWTAHEDVSRSVVGRTTNYPYASTRIHILVRSVCAPGALTHIIMKNNLFDPEEITGTHNSIVWDHVLNWAIAIFLIASLAYFGSHVLIALVEAIIYINLIN